MSVIEFKSKRQKDIEEMLAEVRKLEESGQLSSDTASLADFVAGLPSVKNLRVYTAEQTKALASRPMGNLRPSMRRQLIRVVNRNGHTAE